MATCIGRSPQATRAWRQACCAGSNPGPAARAAGAWPANATTTGQADSGSDTRCLPAYGATNLLLAAGGKQAGGGMGWRVWAGVWAGLGWGLGWAGLGLSVPSSVLPVPGGPQSRTPLGILTCVRVCASGGGLAVSTLRPLGAAIRQ